MNDELLRIAAEVCACAAVGHARLEAVDVLVEIK